jgi:DNA invertase Pin-like site-specific DNA recombinase
VQENASSLAVIFVPFLRFATSQMHIFTQEDDTMDLRYAYGYVRVSTDKQDELSPDSQEKLLREYAHANHIILLKVFFEIGISGRKADKRPSFQEMIVSAKSKDHPVDVILVWKYSRFARNQEESIVYKSLLKKQHNVEVISVSEPLIDGPFGSLIERIIEWMDEYYSIRLSGEVMRGMKEKALRGGYQAVPPLGYDRVKGQTPTVNESEAAIVRMIFQMFVEEHMSLCAIAKQLNLGKYPTKKGAHWNVTHLRYLLGNPFYIGKVRWNYISHASGPNRKNEESEYIISDGIHEPLIDEETFRKSEELLKEAAAHAYTWGHMSAKHWMSGIFRCGCCGGSMVYSSPTKRNKASYTCNNHKSGSCPATNRILVSKLEDAVFDGLEKYIRESDFEYVRKAVRTAPVDSSALLKEQLSDLAKKEKRIRKAYMDGVDSLEEYKENRQLISRQKEELEIQLQSLKNLSTAITDSDKLRLSGNIRDVLDILKSDDVDIVRKSDALRSICEKITYDKAAEKLEFYFIL